MYFLAIAAVGLVLLVFFGSKKSRQAEAVKNSALEDDRLNTSEPELVVELQRKVSHYLQPILSHRFLNNLA